MVAEYSGRKCISRCHLLSVDRPFIKSAACPQTGRGGRNPYFLFAAAATAARPARSCMESSTTCSMSSCGAGLPVQISNWRAAWWTNISMPGTICAPRLGAGPLKLQISTPEGRGVLYKVRGRRNRKAPVYFCCPAQFTTTVIGGWLTLPIGNSHRNRWPSVCGTT
jgi:hypothetical protein